MAAKVSRATAFRVTLGDRVGALAEVLAAARNAGIDLQSVAGYVSGGEGVILAVPADLLKARPAASVAPAALVTTQPSATRHERWTGKSRATPPRSFLSTFFIPDQATPRASRTR